MPWGALVPNYPLLVKHFLYVKVVLCALRVTPTSDVRENYDNGILKTRTSFSFLLSVNPFFCCFSPILASSHLSKPVPKFLMGLNLAI